MKTKSHRVGFFLILFFLSCVFVFSNDIITKAEVLDYEGKYKESLKYLTDNFNAEKPDPEIAWRIARESFEVSNVTAAKDEKLRLFEIGIKTSKPFLENNSLEKRTRAEVIHWYAINYASKMKLLGIFGGRESMSAVPELFKLINKCIEIDDKYSSAYFFKGKLLEDVPFFLGGDKFEMSKNYQEALKYADEKEYMLFAYNISLSYYGRNWSPEKKKENSKKNKSDDGTPLDKSDREYSKDLLNAAKIFYEKNKSHSFREKNIYNDILKQLEKIKK